MPSSLSPPCLHSCPWANPRRLGHFNPPTKQPFYHLTYDVISSPEHHATARQVLQQGIVLLKNSQVGCTQSAPRMAKLGGCFLGTGGKQRPIFRVGPSRTAGRQATVVWGSETL